MQLRACQLGNVRALDFKRGRALPAGLVLLCVLFGGGTSAWGQGVLFGCTGTGAGPSSLYTINPATGASTLIGAMGINACGGLAFQPTTGVLFAVGEDPNTPLLISLWTVNTSTGAATLVGPTGVENIITTAVARISDISFRPSDGVLFAFLQPEPSLTTLNTTTGAATLVGASAIEGKNGNGIAFSAADVLFHTDDVSLSTLNQTTGVPTVIAAHTFPAVSCPMDPRISALAFDGGGTLFGAMNCGSGQNASPIYLVTVNPANAVVTNVAQTRDGLDGIAFQPAAVATPTPTATPTSTPTNTPGGPPCTCQGDADKNDFVNFSDFGSVQSHFGAPADPLTGLGDADCNGFVNFSDFGAVQAHFGVPCP